MKFGEKLKAVMEQLNLTQTQVVGMTGCSKAAISQYLSGKNVPPAEKQSDIAVSLGCDPDLFERDAITPMTPPSVKYSNDKGGIPQLSVKQAARLMHKGQKFVYTGLQQGEFPWGYAVVTSTDEETGRKTWDYFINAIRFSEHERVELRL